MKRPIIRFLTLGALTIAGGCGHPPAYTICLVDVSKSITMDGIRSEFQAVDTLVDKMRRGDRLTVIPITGNAVSETPGHVLTVTAPQDRQPYDFDLVQFRADAHAGIAGMRKEFSERPASRTDILGALDIARQELDDAADDAQAAFRSRTLYVFSDFIEDDETYRFGAEPASATKEDAGVLARRLQLEHRAVLPGPIRVRLVEIESSEQRRLRPPRQNWIRAFWGAYLAPCEPRWTPIEAAVHRGSM